jgi:hypothetical protein
VGTIAAAVLCAAGEGKADSVGAALTGFAMRAGRATATVGRCDAINDRRREERLTNLMALRQTSGTKLTVPRSEMGYVLEFHSVASRFKHNHSLPSY